MESYFSSKWTDLVGIDKGPARHDIRIVRRPSGDFPSQRRDIQPASPDYGSLFDADPRRPRRCLPRISERDYSYRSEVRRYAQDLDQSLLVERPYPAAPQPQRMRREKHILDGRRTIHRGVQLHA